MKAGLFNGWTYETTRTGTKRRRLTRAELREAYRLWAVHADIREGRARG